MEQQHNIVLFCQELYICNDFVPICICTRKVLKKSKVSGRMGTRITMEIWVEINSNKAFLHFLPYLMIFKVEQADPEGAAEL